MNITKTSLIGIGFAGALILGVNLNTPHKTNVSYIPTETAAPTPVPATPTPVPSEQPAPYLAVPATVATPVPYVAPTVTFITPNYAPVVTPPVTPLVDNPNDGWNRWH